ncbi:oligosaccharide flippase family protein [Confluentibacter lentus]|uniref:oligosaccharide flippase family protein n=1 Tax=Confluentibacter lentus TaxID=1699412 RepID=UPI000C2875A5|nr:oligosaccharide flippase family protein [Confluentibacter lentus]
MNKIFNHILNNNLIKLGLFNSFSITIKIIASIISSKALAFFLGPPGLAIVGIYKEFFNMTTNMSSLGLQRGIIRYASELKSKPNESKVFINTVNLIGLLASILMAFFLFLFSNFINVNLFPNDDFSLVIKILAFLMPISVFSVFYLSFLNGLGYVNHIVKINISLYILNMIILVILTCFYNTVGALLGISLVYVLQLISIFMFKPNAFSFGTFSLGIFSNNYVRKLMGYTLMTIFSLMLFPFISILIRSEIIDLLGKDAAGFWEAMKRISENYLLFASSLVMLSVLPQLSKSDSDFKNIVLHFYKSILPLFVIGLFFVFVLKDFIMQLFYSKDFLPTTVLFKWYTIGDLFRISGIVLAANFYATRDIKGYIFTDMFLALVMYVSTILLLRSYGLVGGAFAYFVSYFTYFILLIIVFRKKLFTVKAQS